MCGIAGIVNFKNSNINPASLEKACSVLYNRGPDDSGIWTENNIGLAHRRLAVLDVSGAGRQPMSSHCGRYVIVFNGEIYNYRELKRELDATQPKWTSNSDTEVVLAAYSNWGVDCLTKLRGMFALAIWDKHKKILFAARDRMGVKPFYLHHSNNCFAFASRPGALLALSDDINAKVDTQALRLYLESGYVPAPFSIHEGIKKLPPAHYILLDGKDIQIKKYWDYRSIVPDTNWESRKEEDLLDELDEILSRSVKSRMVSDVPLGAFLSGGIDSSLVVAMMARHSDRPVKSFTIGFDEDAFDESKHALAVSKHLGTEHHCELLKVEDLLDLMPVFRKEFDEPFFDYSAFPVMAVSRLARQHVTVSLSGDGGDELFGGYHYYQLAQRLNPIFKMPVFAKKLLSNMAHIAPGHKSKLLAGALRQPNSAAMFTYMRSIAKDYPSIISREAMETTYGLENMFNADAELYPDTLAPSERGMRFDCAYTLPDDYLQKVDVASMAFSLESREPLLDQDLTEWAMKLPVSWKLRNNTNKYLLRKLAYRYIPREILDRPKQGFSVPIEDWLRGPLFSWASDLLNNKELFQQLPLVQSTVLDLWRLHCSGRRNAHSLLWAVLVLLDFQAQGRLNN